MSLPSSPSVKDPDQGSFPCFSVLEFSDPPASKNQPEESSSIGPQGSFTYDLAKWKHNMQWHSKDDFEAWLEAEQKNKCFELIVAAVKRSSASHARYASRIRYVCSRQGSGGQKLYIEKSEKKREKKVDSKRSGCECDLTVKFYHDSPIVLGMYNAAHAHELGQDNLKYTRLSESARKHIYKLLELKVRPNEILRQIQEGAFDSSADEDINAIKRDHLITMRDIMRIKKELDAIAIQLHSDDGISSDKWVSRLQSKDSVLGYKTCTDPVPLNFSLSGDAFYLILQSPWQRKIAQLYGNSMLHIDGTHNVSQYCKLNLYTILVRDAWGYGIPIAWCMASEGTEAMHTLYLTKFREANPDVLPAFFMSDKDFAQMNAIRSVFPEPDTVLLLCWWHVLHAWQKHFNIHEFPELWKLLKDWIRITDQSEFNSRWLKIQQTAPKSVVDYLQTNWMNDTKLWSAVFRNDRNISENANTNMPIEAFHHILKSIHLEGKRNRRLDTLIYTLIELSIPYYKAKHFRCLAGLEGPDLEERKLLDAKKKAVEIKKNEVEWAGLQVFFVQSKSQPEKKYEVDLDAFSCDCQEFPSVNFCKHICAVQIYFPDQPSTELDLPPPPPPPSPPPTAEKAAPIQAVSAQSASQAAVHLLGQISHDAQLAQSHASTTGLSINIDRLHDLHLYIKSLLPQLPPKQKVPPNKKTAPDFAEAYRRLPPVKTGQKRRHEDAYSGGTQSGSQAKPDAKKNRSIQEVVGTISDAGLRRLQNIGTPSQVPEPKPDALSSTSRIDSKPPSSVPSGETIGDSAQVVYHSLATYPKSQPLQQIAACSSVSPGPADTMPYHREPDGIHPLQPPMQTQVQASPDPLLATSNISYPGTLNGPGHHNAQSLCTSQQMYIQPPARKEARHAGWQNFTPDSFTKAAHQ